jgi:hypothetical protein
MWHFFLAVTCLFCVEFPSEICYHNKSTLVANSFKGPPIPEMGRNVYGEFGISYHSDLQPVGAAVKICAYFNPNRSFCLPDYSAKEILHEQSRWKIYHLAALEMLQFGCSRKLSFTSMTQLQLSDIEVKYRNMDRRFNVQTKFGLLEGEEAKWNFKIDSIYAELKNYEDSVWYQ